MPFAPTVTRYAASVVISMTYGKTTPTSYSDPEVQCMHRCLRRLGAALRPGAHIIDTYPFLRYIPGMTTELRKGHQEELELFRGEVAKVKAKLVLLPSQLSASSLLIISDAKEKRRSTVMLHSTRPRGARESPAF